MKVPRAAALVLGVAIAAGCSDQTDLGMKPDANAEDAASAGDAGVDAGTDAGALPAITWTPCELELGSGNDDAECGTIDAPVRWDRPDGAKIPIFVQRFLAPNGPARAQLWMLQGGPGAAGNGWAPYVRYLSSLDPTIDFYVPDHRGTGRSARLGCPAQEAEASPGAGNITAAEWPDCIAAVQTEWGDNLAGFSSEGAARDIEALIARTREPGKHVIVFGASYGTTWAHRFLQLFPEGADGVAIDSTNWPDRTYEDYDRLWDGVAREVFDACGADAFCASKLGADPWAALQQLEMDLGTGHCRPLVRIGFTGRVLAQAVAWMIAYRQLRASALALVHRVRRCDAVDQAAAVHVVNNVFGLGDDPLFSAVLSQNILNSEIGRVPTSSTARAFAGTCTVCLGAGERPPFAEAWPRYDFQLAFTEWAATAKPLLIMNGGLDPFAPMDRLEEAGVRAAFTAPNQHIIRFPVAPHGATFDSPTTTAGETSCGIQLLLQFIADPRADLEDSCLDRLAPIDFTVSSTSSRVIFDRPDAWEP